MKLSSASSTAVAGCGKVTKFLVFLLSSSAAARAVVLEWRELCAFQQLQNTIAQGSRAVRVWVCLGLQEIHLLW